MTATSVPASGAHAPDASVSSLLSKVAHGDTATTAVDRRAVQTGFDPLDRVLGGGLRNGDLALLAGAPGVGKTIATLQWAATMARNGRRVIYVCYEHDEPLLLARLLCMEMGLAATPDDISNVERSSEAVTTTILAGEPLEPLSDRHPLLRDALANTRVYADRLQLVRGKGTHTDVRALQALVEAQDSPAVLIVDYLQKVSVRPEPDNENEKVLRITESLKELALSQHVPVVAVAAAGETGLEAQRLRMHHLRGSSAVAYECDIAIIMNDKYSIVSKSHVAFDPVRASAFRRAVVFSVEKNRGGPAGVDVEFEKHFGSYRFDPVGSYVAERLIDERIATE